MNEILEQHSLEQIDEERWLEDFVYMALPNLRQCKRHLAQFEFSVTCIGKYTDSTDLAYVAIVQLLEPNLWRKVGENWDWFVGGARLRNTDEPNIGLENFRQACINNGKEKIWNILRIMFPNINSKVEGHESDSLSFMVGHEKRNFPARVTNRFAFMTYQTRKNYSEWTSIETQSLKAVFQEQQNLDASQPVLADLLKRFPKDIKVWLRHFIDQEDEYDDFDLIFFVNVLIEGLEAEISNGNVVPLLLETDFMRILEKASDAVGRGYYPDEINNIGHLFNQDEKFNVTPLRYSAECEAMARLVGRTEFTEEEESRLSDFHTNFWLSINENINHPYIYGALHSWMNTDVSFDFPAKKFLSDIVNDKDFYEEEGNLLQVLLLAWIVYSHDLFKTKISANDVFKSWDVLLGEQPDYLSLFKSLERIDINKKPELYQRLVEFWKLHLHKVINENSKSSGLR